MEDIQKIKEFFSKPLEEAQEQSLYKDWDQFEKPSKIKVYLNNDKTLEITPIKLKGGKRVYDAILQAFIDDRFDITNKVIQGMMNNLSEVKKEDRYKRPIVTNKQGEKFILQGFSTSGYYLIPYDGSKYWEPSSVSKNKWIPEKSINWDDYNFTKQQFEKLKASHDESEKEINKKFQDMNEAKEEDVVDTITMDVPLFIRMLEYSREDAAEDMDLHDVTEKAIALNKEKSILSMDDYDAIVGGAEEIQENKGIEVGDIVSKKYASTEEDYTKEFKVTGITGMKADLQDTKTGKNTRISLSDLSKVPMKEATSDYMKRRKAQDDYVVSKKDKPAKLYNPIPSGKTDYMKRREKELAEAVFAKLKK